MKKLAIVLAAAMLVSAVIAGCGNNGQAAGEETAAETQNQTQAAAAEAETKESILDKDENGNFIKPDNYGEVVKLGKYKGLEITLEDATVTDEEVETEINAALEGSAETKPVDRAAKLGDVVNIDYEGKKDGVAFDGGTAQGFDLELGSGRFIPGFEDGLVGAKKGETRDLDLTFPEQYQSAELAGQAVVFTVKVNEVKEKVLPELTDEWVKEHTGGACATVADFKKDVRQKLEDYRKLDVESNAQNQLISQVIADSEINVTTEAIEYEYQTMIGMYDEYAAMMGVTTDEYLEMYGVDPQAMKIQLSYYAEESCKQRLMEDAIINAEGLEVTYADKQSLADQYGYSVEEMESIYGEEFATYAKSYKVVRFIYENAVKK